ncbi:MAG: DUF6186 family protein [Pseudonocardiaceae bacterium]
MTGRELTIAAYVLITAAIVVLEVLERRRDSTVPTFSDVVSTVAGTLPGRIALIALWWWLGWHFLARSSVPPLDL